MIPAPVDAATNAKTAMSELVDSTMHHPIPVDLPQWLATLMGITGLLRIVLHQTRDRAIGIARDDIVVAEAHLGDIERAFEHAMRTLSNAKHRTELRETRSS